jgi:hypothetical protein
MIMETAENRGHGGRPCANAWGDGTASIPNSDKRTGAGITPSGYPRGRVFAAVPHDSRALAARGVPVRASGKRAAFRAGRWR